MHPFLSSSNMRPHLRRQALKFVLVASAIHEIRRNGSTLLTTGTTQIESSSGLQTNGPGHRLVASALANKFVREHKLDSKYWRPD